MNSNLNEHEEKVKKPITVSWQDGDTTHVQTTVIHKRVPSAGVILLTAFTFTVIGVFIASIVFLARFTEIKTIMSAITGSAETRATQSPGHEAEFTPVPNEPTSNMPLVTVEPNGNRNQQLPMTGSSSLSELYDNSVDGVVIVENHSRDTQKPTHSNLAGIGTGFIISKDGYILTNAHVVSDAKAVWITLHDSTRVKAELIGSDVGTDIAVLKISVNKELLPLPIGDSSTVKTGDFVFAIGHPTGEELSFTATFGMVGAVDRAIVIDGVRNRFIQIDAAINPGNSGGPLLNIEGSLIGINTAVDARAEGIGFAIPINKARRVMADLMGQGRVAPLWLGLMAEDLDSRMAMALGLKEARGVLVGAVFEGTPAAKAGIEPGDIIESINASPVRDRRDYINVLRNQTGGESLRLSLRRGEKVLALDVTPVPFEDDTARKLMERRWGLAVREGKQGLVIQSVRPDGPAAFLRKGDLITGVGGMRVKNMSELLQAFRKERLAGQVLLQVVRGDRGYYARLVL